MTALQVVLLSEISFDGVDFGSMFICFYSRNQALAVFLVRVIVDPFSFSGFAVCGVSHRG